MGDLWGPSTSESPFTNIRFLKIQGLDLQRCDHHNSRQGARRLRLHGACFQKTRRSWGLEGLGVLALAPSALGKAPQAAEASTLRPVHVQCPEKSTDRKPLTFGEGSPARPGQLSGVAPSGPSEPCARLALP